MVKNAEELWQKSKRLKKEEEEEDQEINLYYQRLGYMLEHCAENDREIRGLLEDQQGMLNVLCMSKREFADALSIHVSCHM
jgi:hypothetical protein